MKSRSEKQGVDVINFLKYFRRKKLAKKLPDFEVLKNGGSMLLFFKYFRRKSLAKKLADFDSKYCYFMPKIDDIDFRENYHFSPTTGKNIQKYCHCIAPSVCRVGKVTSNNSIKICFL
jgi:hypothetical protein